MKHNIGELVQVKSRLWFEQNKNNEICNNFIYEMSAYCGKAMYVSSISDWCLHPYSLKMGDGTTLNYYWDDKWFEDEVDPTNNVLLNSVNIASDCKVGDEVEINSKEWYNNNKNNDNVIETPIGVFTQTHSLYCGKRCKVVKVYNYTTECFRYNLELLDNNEHIAIDGFFDNGMNQTRINVTWADYMFKRVDTCTQNNSFIDINPNLYDLVVNENSIQVINKSFNTISNDYISSDYSLLNDVCKPNQIVSTASTYELNIERPSVNPNKTDIKQTMSSDKYIGKYVVIKAAYIGGDVKMCNIDEHYFDNLSNMCNVKIDKKTSNNLYNITIMFNVAMQHYVDEKLFVSKIENGFYILKTEYNYELPYLWSPLWIDIDLYNEDIDPYKEYVVNDQVKVRARYTIDNNKGKYYITPNCEFTTSMWKYCNNIYYIDEVIDFGSYDFKLYKLRNLEGNVLPYLWSNTWFYGIDNYEDEPTFNKEKIILNF